MVMKGQSSKSSFWPPIRRTWLLYTMPLILWGMTCMMDLVEFFDSHHVRVFQEMQQTIPAGTMAPYYSKLSSSSLSSSLQLLSPPPSSRRYYNTTDEQLSELNSKNSLFGVNARAFPDWKGPVPCFPPSEQEIPWKRGLLYLKLMKTGGSTTSGVNARIARNEAKRINATSFTSCAATLEHSQANEMCPHRNRNESFLWATVRDPISRFFSEFFHFHVTRNKTEPTDEALEAASIDAHYLGWLSTSTRRPYHPDNDPASIINEIMSDYDFIGVTERMEESTVALAMLLHVPLADVLYLNAKQNGGYDDLCKYIAPSFSSPGMEAFIQSSKFYKHRLHWEHVLHQVVNRSLDLTIDLTLGRDKFKAQLARFQHAQGVAQTKCQHLNGGRSCSINGQWSRAASDCLFMDSGCGYHCLNQVADELDLW